MEIGNQRIGNFEVEAGGDEQSSLTLCGGYFSVFLGDGFESSDGSGSDGEDFSASADCFIYDAGVLCVDGILFAVDLMLLERLGFDWQESTLAYVQSDLSD